MKVRLPWFVEKVEKYDPEFYERVKSVVEIAVKPGVLDAKTKILITLALDALKA